MPWYVWIYLLWMPIEIAYSLGVTKRRAPNSNIFVRIIGAIVGGILWPFGLVLGIFRAFYVSGKSHKSKGEDLWGL